MADEFLKALSTQIQSQFSVGENTTNTLDTVVNGQNVKYGALGDFAKKIDQSAERRYVEEGFIRKDPANLDVKQVQVLMQEPNATILVKKKMFTSLAENYRPEYMDSDERIYIKSVKVLLQNKCRQIAALEKLSKIQKISSILGNVDEQLMNIVFTLADQFDVGNSPNQVVTESQNISVQKSLSEQSGAKPINNFKSTIDSVRRLYAFNKSSPLTNWITDNTNLFKSDFGEGTGVIELTNFSSVNTNTNLKGNGNMTLTISDPYEVMTITEYDIEKAMSDATNLFYNTKTYQFGLQNVDQLIGDLQARLSSKRSQRGASPISFKINPDTILGKRITAIIENNGVEILFEYNAFSESALTSGLQGAENTNTVVPAANQTILRGEQAAIPYSVNYGVKISAAYFKNGSIAGFDGLDSEKSSPLLQQAFSQSRNEIQGNPLVDSELSIFQQLIQSIYNKINLQQSSQNSLQQSNQQLNYVRKKLRFNFLGKLIVQPMDPVHVYISTKTKYDNKLLTGITSMFNGLGYLQGLGGALNDIQKQVSLFQSDNILSQIERAVFVGADFPHFLWAMMRPQFVTEKEGTHVFGGIVSTSKSSYSNGSYTVSISADDNFKYFSFGHVNFLPAVDKWNGVFYDPLTPFKTKFGTISTNYKDQKLEPLDENNAIVRAAQSSTDTSSGSPLLKFKSGPNAGRPVTLGNYISDATVDPVTKRLTKTFYAPDGLVYKWKEGIGVFTFSGNSFNINAPENVGTPSITTEPFASQDIMNCISLLITGIPYNFATYWKAVSNYDGFARDPSSNRDAAYSFYQSLQNDLRKRNALWGNFIPFKNLSMDEQSLRLKFKKFDEVQDVSNKIQEKVERLRNLNNNIFAVNGVFASPDLAIFYQQRRGVSANAENYQKQANELYDSIQKDIVDFSKQNSDSVFNQIGNDVSFDTDVYLYGADNKSTLPATRRILRRQVDFLTRRLSYNVRANQDKNLFIVDDFYDKDYDIAAFNSDLNNGALQLYQNQFLTVSEKITTVANLLNLEVFCDTQGHIRARPPQYNRMPSSVFYNMMYQKKALGIQIFPEFLDSLFNDQITVLKERVEILEDHIRLNAAALGLFSDQEVQQLVNNPSITNTNAKTPGQSFIFLSGSNGNIVDFTALLAQANPDQTLKRNETFINLQNQSENTKNLFTPFQKLNYAAEFLKEANLVEVNSTLSDSRFSLNNVNNFLINERSLLLRRRLEEKSGQKVVPDDFLLTLPQGIQSKAVDLLKILNNIAENVSERQKVIKILYKTLVNCKEFKSLDLDSSISNKLLTQGSNPNQDIPEVFEHMIEDETYDDYGPGSGQRYIIKQSQIISYDISENPPEFTTVQVQGVLNEFDSRGGDTFAALPDNGNALVAARAVDYDLWKNYGLLTVQSVNVPFLTDPESQCGPFAASLLSRVRNNILRGTVNLSGNEYYQPGEVVYFEGKNLLFYVENVSHNFTFGSQYTTQLTLTYGHSPGEYIPTALDIIGKMLYRNKQIATFRIQRETSSFDNASYGAIIFDPNNSKKGFESCFNSDSVYAPANATVVTNMLNMISFLVYNQNVKQNNLKIKVELRVYFDKKASSQANVGNKAFAEYVKFLLTGNNVATTKLSPNNNQSTPITLPAELVEVKIVDISDENDPRSPSNQAMSAARSLSGVLAKTIANNASNSDDTIRKALFENIVDCWVQSEIIPPPIIEETPITEETTPPAAGNISPAQPTNDTNINQPTQPEPAAPITPPGTAIA